MGGSDQAASELKENPTKDESPSTDEVSAIAEEAYI